RVHDGGCVMSTLLNAVVLLPAAGALLILLIPRRHSDAIRMAALGVSLVSLVLSILIVTAFVPAASGMQFVTNTAWIDSPAIHYHIGVDGLSVFFPLLVTLLSVFCVLASWRSVEERVKEFFFFLLLLETGTIGVFVALDLFLFYVFWE